MKNNLLYFGDNLNILKDCIDDESVDLIYLDPPFNSKANYAILFKEKNGTSSEAQIQAFKDSWSWNLESLETYQDIIKNAPVNVANVLESFINFLGKNDMMAYLVMMSARLLELHRVLKKTGSIYLHCDPTASHYLKILMDAIFGYKNFRNEIVWRYRGGGISKKNFGKKHDIIFWYSKGKQWSFDVSNCMQEYSEETKKRMRHFNQAIRNTKGYEYTLKEEGKYPDDVWDDINIINPASKERLGYPTQKPEKLLERIIQASSNEGDIVLDPFCGCGTAVAVAEKLNRKWIGIDITHLSIMLVKRRLNNSFGKELSSYDVMGEPKDVKSAYALAQQDRYQFEWWALDLVDARPAQDKKKGADRGVDGYIFFFDENSKAKTIVVQVKSGNVSAKDVRDLKGVMEREKAYIGALVTLKKPTKPMMKEAIESEFYVPKHYPNRRYPKLQILTIEEIFNGAKIKYPDIELATFQKASRISKNKQIQTKLC